MLQPVPLSLWVMEMEMLDHCRNQHMLGMKVLKKQTVPKRILDLTRA